MAGDGGGNREQERHGRRVEREAGSNTYPETDGDRDQRDTQKRWESRESCKDRERTRPRWGLVGGGRWGWCGEPGETRRRGASQSSRDKVN